MWSPTDVVENLSCVKTVIMDSGDALVTTDKFKGPV